ncbi:MAG TPA: hypothetical protein VFS69_04330 [Sphingomicrobium sp.]|nr:hypothetical protein [Sphingomicrobium sp.]
MKADFARWFLQQRLTGVQALLFAAISLGAALALRAAVDGMVTGCEFTPYLPAVLVCAILLRWWQAALAALAAPMLHGSAFMGAPWHFLDSACFQSTGGMFLLSSAVIIGVAVMVRQMLELQRNSGANGSGGIVFSLEKGEVWASWYGTGLPVRLGDRNRVETMMADFLAQSELGKRLESNGEPAS